MKRMDIPSAEFVSWIVIREICNLIYIELIYLSCVLKYYCFEQKDPFYINTERSDCLISK
jgi:hypothetical protein